MSVFPADRAPQFDAAAFLRQEQARLRVMRLLTDIDLVKVDGVWMTKDDAVKQMKRKSMYMAARSRLKRG